MLCSLCGKAQLEGAIMVANKCMDCARTVPVEAGVTADLFVSCKSEPRLDPSDVLSMVVDGFPVPLVPDDGAHACPLCQHAFATPALLRMHFLSRNCLAMRFVCSYCAAETATFAAATRHLTAECCSLRCLDCLFSGSASAFLRHKLQTLVQQRLYELAETLNHSFRRDLLSPANFSTGAAVGSIVHQALTAVVETVEGKRQPEPSAPPVADVALPRMLRCEARRWRVLYEGSLI